MKNGKEIGSPQCLLACCVHVVLTPLVLIFIQLPRALSRTDNHITRCHFILFLRQGASLYRSSPIFFLSSLLFPSYFPFPLFYTSTLLFLSLTLVLFVLFAHKQHIQHHIIKKSDYSTIVHDCSNPFFPRIIQLKCDHLHDCSNLSVVYYFYFSFNFRLC